MTAPQHPLRYLARVTIQFETPFIIGGAQDDLLYDSVFVTDANGLPAFPGSSLAGILRHAWADAGYGNGNDIFGFQKKKQGHGSRLSVSWGCIHNQEDRPVEGLIVDRTVLAKDPVLSESLVTTARDHVRINHKGTAAKRGKFDERSVSAGHRFTFELMLEGSEADADNWQRLLSLLRSDAIRIGGKTRRGYGQFSVVTLKSATFDISTEQGFGAFVQHPAALALPCRLPDILAEQPSVPSTGVMAALTLAPEAFWMIGGGFDTDVDMAPLTANRIVWDGGKGSVDSNRAILTGSAIKGAISHRVTFHYNRLNDKFAKEAQPEEHTGTKNKAVASLFGVKKEKDEKGESGSDQEAPQGLVLESGEKKEGEKGQRGRVIISDLFINEPGPQKIINHVSIDRFTGGARTLEGALFDEKPYYRGNEFCLNVAVVDADAITDQTIRKAFAATLLDLADGRLALGAGAGRGNGYFKGKVEWNEPGEAWLGGGNQA